MRHLKWIQGVIVIGVSAGMLGAMSVSASANSQYSAARSNSVRLVWRKSMKQHAYTATQGARYSKHLGVRYSNNDVTPTVTWYTDAHEKLYKKYQGHAAIYYHVKSADGTLQGWIWRGYLKKVNATKSVTPNATTTATGKTTSKTIDYDALAKTAILNMGGGAKPDPQTMQMAKSILNKILTSHVHFLTQAEAYPDNSAAVNDNDVVLGDVTADNLNTASEKYMFNLLKSYGIDGAGYGAKKADSSFFMLNDLNANDTLHTYFDPSSDFYGQQGLTRKNFFVQAKIGVAMAKGTDGRTAMFAMFRYPAKYAKLVAD